MKHTLFFICFCRISIVVFSMSISEYCFGRLYCKPITQQSYAYDAFFNDTSKTKKQFVLQSNFLSLIPSYDIYFPSYGNRTLLLVELPLTNKLCWSYGAGFYYSKIKTYEREFMSHDHRSKSYRNFVSMSIAPININYTFCSVFKKRNIFLQTGLIWDVLIYDKTKTIYLTNDTVTYGTMYPYSKKSFFSRFIDKKTNYFNVYFSLGLKNKENQGSYFALYFFAGNHALHSIQQYSFLHFGVSINYILKSKNIK